MKKIFRYGGRYIKNLCSRKIIKIMRNTILLLLLGVFNLYATDSYAQNARLSLHLSNIPIKTVLEKIEDNSEFYFLFNAKLIDVDKEVSISVENEKISDILASLFTGTGIEYFVYDRQIILSSLDSSRPAIPLLQQSVSGIITDKETGDPMPGVNIQIKGTTFGTISDAAGQYSLSVPDKNGILIFSFIGYISQEIALNGRTTINVELLSDISQLEEVVVIGYGTVRKSDLTGSVSSVKNEQITSVTANDIRQSLQGRAAGVDVNYGSRRPGEGANILIRGHRSFIASNDPLYVIDGIPTTTNIGDINIADIESIEVLKDASATAIYGSRAANGVVIIQTKRGKAGKTVVTYDGYYSISKIARRLDMMNGPEFAEMRREAYRNNSKQYYKSSYPDPYYDFFDPDGLFRKDPLEWESVRLGYEWEDPEMTIVRRDGNGIPIYHPEKVRSTDWASLVTRPGYIQQHQISISGGTAATQVYLSGTYYDEIGTIKGQDFTRYNIKLNVDHIISKRLKVGASTSFLSSIQNRGSNLYGSAIKMSPLAVPYDNDGLIVNYPGNETFNVNPIYDIDGLIDERKRNRFFSAIYLEWEPIKELKYRLNASPDFSNYRNGQFQESLTNARVDGGSRAIYNTQGNINYVLENILTYNKTINDNHNLTVTLMQSIQSERRETSGITATNFTYDYQKWYNIGTAEVINSFSSNLVETQLASFMGRLAYSYKNKYLITLTGRQDGASVLAEGNKFDFFPALALAWKINKERFLEGTDFIEDLKLRVGYGYAGNSSISPYQTGGTLSRTVQDFGDVAAYGYRPSSIPNKDLRWEKTASANAGIDFGIFKNRITGSIDFYRTITSNLLMNMQLPTTSGFNSVTMNIGSTKNTGIETQISFIILSTARGLKWNTDFVFFKDKEEIVELYGGKNDDVGNKWFIGHPINVAYDYVYEGIWQDTPEDAEKMAVFNANGNRFTVGKIKLADINNDKVINADDRAIIGSSMPKWTGSWSNSISYKGFDLTTFLYVRQGATITSSAYVASLGGRYQCLDVNYWTPTHSDKLNANYPRPSTDWENPEYISTLTHVDGSFVKLRNVTLSYTLPMKYVSRLNMNNLRVYISAQDPIVWTKFKGLDPEGNTGNDTPSIKLFTLGLNATF